MFNAEGLVALVTGASGGIGAAIATTLHAAGAQVVLHGTRASALEELAHSLGGQRVFTVTAKLDQSEDTATLWQNATAAAGSAPNVLVNNAGITRDTLLLRMKDDDWDAVHTVNLRAAFVLCRAAIKDMMKQRFGRIINITSVVGVTGNAGQTNYCAAKAGLIGFSKALAAETASRGITVNALAPGFIATPMTDVLTDAQRDGILRNVPLARLGTPAEIASAALFLASREASYITGQTLHVNGGLVMP